MVRRHGGICCLVAVAAVLLMSTVVGQLDTTVNASTTPLNIFEGGQLGRVPFVGPAFLTASANMEAATNASNANNTVSTVSPVSRWNIFGIRWCPNLWSFRQPTCHRCSKDNDCELDKFCCSRALIPFPFWRCCS